METVPELATGFADRIQRLRARYGLSQGRLAESLGVSRMTVIRWEQGKARPSALAWRRLELAEREPPAPIWTEREPAAPTRTPRFVGRDAELRLLGGLLDSAAHGSGRLALIAGEPGIGKSRLLGELAARASAAGWRVLVGRAYDGGGLPPYLPIAEALQEYVRTCPIDVLRNQLGDGAAEVALVVREVAIRLPQLARAPARGTTDARYYLLESLVDFLLAIARSVPGLLLVLDDLQWADRPTLLWLLHLARRLGGARLVVACAHRVSEVDGHPLAEVLADLKREQLAESVPLGPLTQDEAAALVAGMLDAVPSVDVVHRLWRGTEGTPFFLEELVQHLRAEGLDLTDPELVLERWDVPRGARQVIGKQLGRLSPAALDLLQMAAVVGDGFDFEVLAAACGAAPATRLDALDELLLARLLREAPDGYACGHAFIRQAVYEQLSLPRRQERHLRAAEAIEKVRPRSRNVNDVAALAAHYRLAGPTADPDKPIDYALRAGEAAATAYAWELAAGHWQSALDLMQHHATDRERRVELLERLGGLLLVSRLDLGKAIGALEEALAFWLAQGKPDRAARVHVALGRCYLAEPGEHRDIPRSLDHYRAAQDVLEREPPSADLGWLHMGLAHAANLVLDGGEALWSARRAIEIGEALEDTALRLEATARYAGSLFRGGSLADGLAMHERVVREAEHANILAASFISASNFGSLLVRARDPRAAERVCRRELDKTGRAYPPAVRAQLTNILASACVRSGQVATARELLGGAADAHVWLAYAEGDWDRAETVCATTLRRLRRVGDRVNQVELLQGIARLAAARCDWASQERALADSLALLEAGELTALEMFSRPDLAVLCARLGRHDEAASHLARCRAVVGRHEDWRGVTGRLALAEAILAAGGVSREDAERSFDSAAVTFGSYDLPWDEAETHELWAAMLHAAGLLPAASVQFDAAQAIYRRIGAGSPWLRRLDALRDRWALRPGRRADGLTAREIEVLRLLAAGQTNSEIASALVISVRTVERHIETIYAKVGAAGKAARTVAAAYAHREGLLLGSA